MNTLPLSLPGPSLSFTVSPASSVLRTRVGGGLPVQFPRFQRQFASVRVEWIMSGHEYRLFEEFIETLNYGSDWFLMNLPTGDGYKMQRVRMSNGQYSVANVGVLSWKVTMTLDLYEYTVISSDELDQILTIGGDEASFIAASERLYWIVNTHIPSLWLQN